MKLKFKAILLGMTGSLLLSGAFYAENFDLSNMTTADLNGLKEQIENELDTNHDASSSEISSINDAIKGYVNSKYGEDNVSWAWIDYTYTKDWSFYSVSTHADIRKEDGGKADYNVYGEVIDKDGVFSPVYITIGTEEILNTREMEITDERILKSLGLTAVTDNQTTTSDSSSSENVETEASATETPETEPVILAKRGDKNETVVEIQEMLIRLGYLSGNADGSFGGGTESAIMKYQSDKGIPSDGIISQSVYDQLKADAAAAPEPEVVISISASELYNKFDANAIAAKAEYTGKKIQVTGTVDSIDEDFLGSPYVTLKADDYGFTSIQCYFPKDSLSELVSLSSGQRVTIEGTCGDLSLMSVTVKNCQLIG